MLLILSIFIICYLTLALGYVKSNSKTLSMRKKIVYNSLNDNNTPFRTKPNTINPNMGVNKGLEKFLMMYTCKICTARNAQMITKVAYFNGMVVSTCKDCKNKHLIADNEKKLDFQTFGKTIEDYLKSKGEKYQKLSLTKEDLENYFLIDQDGEISLVPKNAGQPPLDSTIVNYPEQ